MQYLKALRNHEDGWLQLEKISQITIDTIFSFSSSRLANENAIESLLPLVGAWPGSNKWWDTFPVCGATKFLCFFQSKLRGELGETAWSVTFIQQIKIHNQPHKQNSHVSYHVAISVNQNLNISLNVIWLLEISFTATIFLTVVR